MFKVLLLLAYRLKRSIVMQNKSMLVPSYLELLSLFVILQVGERERERERIYMALHASYSM